MQHFWFVLALSASISWGLSYALVEQVLKVYSVPFVMWVSGMVAVLGYGAILLFQGQLMPQLQLMKTAPQSFAWYLVLNGLFFVIGNMAILYAVTMKNATVVSVIEITYPLFVALFTLVLFKHNSLNVGTAAGCLMIISGAATVFWFNRG